MNNTIIFLRHAETKKEADVLVSNWVLTDRGKHHAKELAESGIFDDVEVIISSGEQKSYQTALPLGKRLKKEVIPEINLNEIDRDKGKLMTKEEYDKMKERIFADLNYTAYGWETASHALDRFKEAVEEIDAEYEKKKILIVAHGTVMTLYFSHLQDQMDRCLERWKALRFGDWGVVKEGKVIKDIV